ncbi:MAG: ATP-dependent Clp protease ATP-binding subunit [Clostridiaceae bacterium]|jgi:ATP-dependent Clp protease ATP-binding subunit ClpC|nr:ATP-dependent Clp protease ATP-binding subunit [Clostridiaceae bacterium]
MIKCSICKKNIAVIFITKVVNGKQEPVGLCMQCAQKQGIAPLDQIIQQTGLSQSDFENLNNQMLDLFENMDVESLEDIFPTDEESGSNQLLRALNSLPEGTTSDMDDKGGKTSNYDNVKVKSKKQKKHKFLDTYGTNLTDRAEKGEIDRIIGREHEIERVIQILNRRAKNNPVLIGEPGVGKTAIAEGLAVRIVNKQVPARFFASQIYLLDLAAVVAGTQFRGQFEARMKSILNEAKESGNVILVIDELHNIVGAGDAEGGAMNAANILKPALARGDVQIIGATTLDEYRKHIEKDAALERRFQPVLVDEPTVSESIEILKGIKNYYEDYHQVLISDEVIECAVMLSDRYIHDRFLPDKAIDVIDEAGSRVNLKNQGLVELESLRSELKKVQEIKEMAALNDDYKKAADYKVEECRLTEKINKLSEEFGTTDITKDDIAYVIESWTKIPVSKITEAEAQKLICLEERLHKRVVGQERAVQSVSKAIRRNRSDFRRKRSPNSFIFVGPTGVGKTELARAVAEELFGNEDAMIRLDMSEYMEKHTVSKLIGAPPGYVGYDQGGQLTEKVRRKPYSVILLDEIEKAHPDVYNMLLQIMEDGRLTDSHGRTVGFENTIIIMTSNAGTSNRQYGIGYNNEGSVALEKQVMDAVKDTFRPEFLNRVDEVIVFEELTKEQLGTIVDIMIEEVREDSLQKGIEIKVSQKAKDALVEKGYSPKYGARPLRKKIQQYIEDELAERYLKGEISRDCVVSVDFEDGEFIFDITKNTPLIESSDIM